MTIFCFVYSFRSWLEKDFESMVRNLRQFPKLLFTWPDERLQTKHFVSEIIVFLSIFDFSGQNRDFWKKFRSGWLAIYSTCPWEQFQGKNHFFKAVLHFILPPSPGKNQIYRKDFRQGCQNSILHDQKNNFRKTYFVSWNTICSHHFWKFKQNYSNLSEKKY